MVVVMRECDVEREEFVLRVLSGDEVESLRIKRLAYEKVLEGVYEPEDGPSLR